jgi:hypothetical protein
MTLARAYLATAINLASRQVVGWALADHMGTELVEVNRPGFSGDSDVAWVSRSWVAGIVMLLTRRSVPCAWSSI